MILSTHAITGAAIASVLPNNPVLGFAAGFLSHFLIDSIPHWDYKLRSAKKDPNNSLNDDLSLGKDFLLDLIKISIDGLLGMAVVIFLFFDYSVTQLFSLSVLKSVIFWGITGALIPDFLQFVYFKFRHEPFTSLQRFHDFIHGKRIPSDHWILGISLQIIFIALVVYIFKFVI